MKRAGDTEGATGWRWLVEEHEPDIAGLHASLLADDTLDLLIQKYESSTGTPLAEPLKEALVQRGVKDRYVLNHLVMHATRLNAYASVCEEVRSIMLTRATLMNTAQLMDSGAMDKAKGSLFCCDRQSRL